MINITDKTTIYLACGYTDMRKSINGLSELVLKKFELDVFDNSCFVFCNKSKDLIKILLWEDNGFWLLLRRLERNRFKWPTNETDLMKLDFSELEILIKAPALEQKLKRKELFCDSKIN